MFGLNEITYWQFSKGILFCLLVYYLILIAYLAIKSKVKVEKTDFELEALNLNQEIKAEYIPSSQYAVKRIVSTDNAEENSIVRPDEDIDSSGLPLDTFARPCKMETSQFEEELAFAVSQTPLS